MMIKKVWVGFAFLMSVSLNARAENLSPEALYHRCFVQLTGHRISDADPLLAMVRANTLSAVNACLKVLDTAKLKRSGDRLTLNSDTEIGRSVLGHMHDVHSTFFSERAINVPATTLANSRTTLDFLDPSAPALYYTRALFGPSLQASSIVTFDRALRPTRVDKPNSGLFTTFDKSRFYFTNDFRFADAGELLGLEELASGVDSLVAAKGRIDLGRTLGGGFLGSGMYLLQTVNNDEKFKATLAQMPRRWSSAVYRDVLCREFPAVRFEDARAFVKPTSPLPFRQEQSCNQCHSSMDRTGAVLRNFQYFYDVTDRKIAANLEKRGPFFFTTYLATKPAETGWPDSEIESYSERPTIGTLYLRSAFSEGLIEKKVEDVGDLGAKLAETNDFYLCLANRYYDYFTKKGIKLADARELNALAAADTTESFKKRLATLRTLATALKTQQSLRSLIETIIKSPEYADSAFGQ